MYGLSCLENQASRGVKFDRSDCNHRVCFKFRQLGTTNGSPQPCREYFRTEGFRNVIVGSGIQCLDGVFLRVAHGNNEDWKASSKLSNLPAGLSTTDSWHVQVEQNTIELRCPHQRYGLLAARSLNGVKPQAGQCRAQS